MADRCAPASLLELDRIGVVLRGRDVLSDVSLDIAQGERVVILGANGAGKSVLLRVMHALIVPTAGRIAWPGRVEAPPQAMVFQRPMMLRTSVLSNVVYGLKLAGVDARLREVRARAALARASLEHLSARNARTLSGGEQQRAALARAWALEPRILFLDEPTASLDPNASREVERVIGDIHAAGTTIVMTTHELAQARRIADRIVFIAAGRLCETTPAPEFFGAPRSPEARGFIGGELV